MFGSTEVLPCEISKPETQVRCVRSQAYLLISGPQVAAQLCSAQHLTAAGKVYRREIVSRTHVEAFHQFELFSLAKRGELDAWQLAGRIMGAVDRVLPRAEVRVTPTEYPMSKRAWSLDVLADGQWLEMLAWGEYADWVLRALGADPEQHCALGAGFGLERFAALKYQIDDIRKIAGASLG